MCTKLYIYTFLSTEKVENWSYVDMLLMLYVYLPNFLHFPWKLAFHLSIYIIKAMNHWSIVVQHDVSCMLVDAKKIYIQTTNQHSCSENMHYPFCFNCQEILLYRPLMATCSRDVSCINVLWWKNASLRIDATAEMSSCLMYCWLTFDFLLEHLPFRKKEGCGCNTTQIKVKEQ